MNRDKQIAEMAKDLYTEIEYDTWYYSDDNYTEVIFDYRKTAENIINKGYRKSTDVAREIFEEIESKLILNKAIHCGQKFYHTRLEDDIAELKKKYTEGEG